MMVILPATKPVPPTDEPSPQDPSAKARQNWKKVFAVRKFLGLSKTMEKQAPAEFLLGGLYKVGKKIANGSFGQLRLAKNIKTGKYNAT